jgi:hypothetical protein
MKSAVLLGTACLVLCTAAGDAAPPKTGAGDRQATARTIDFGTDIEPIFQRACVSCHGPHKQRGGLRLDDGPLALKGGNSGAVIVPGKGAGSRLVRLVSGLDPELRMPPEGKPPIASDEVAKIRAWIDQGALWPARLAATTQAASKHWAFQPVRRPPLPAFAPGRLQESGRRNPIDAFIRARLDKEGMSPSAEADRTTLVRRLCLDLLGLPPTPEQVENFVNDPRPDAYNRLVDRLLALPHYGERWGRHWLDLARYADSDGYEADRPRPFAWRYREWVIEAFNRDLPFDQFTIEQLAGDLLPGAGLSQKTATGFHRNTLTNREGGTDKEQFRVEACVDRVNTTAKVFLGLTLGCAQCHDHKYDPFSQREYYELFAFFNSDKEVDLPARLPGSDEAGRRAGEQFERKKAELLDAIARYKKEQLASAVRKWEGALTREQTQKLPANVQAIVALPPEKRGLKQAKLLADYVGGKDQTLLKLQKALLAHQKTAPAVPIVPTLALGPGRKTHVLLRGDFLRPGVEVQPGTPAVLPPLRLQTAAVSKDVGSVGKATRLDLARWLVEPANPLTPRVISNWVWQHYFGRGLVPTLEDFGTQGEPPSHPELLDFLASELVSPAAFEGRPWSLKALHKLIVTSATYRQSSRHRPGLAGRDPLNVLLGRQNRLRLEAEILRDNALAVSGLLVRTIGGPSVKPPQPAGISELTYAGSAKWVESKGSDRFRRGLYTWFQRTSPYPMLTTFDAPDGVLSCVRREKSNTPLQALTLLNDAVFVECAQALGRRILAELPRASVDERLDYVFRLCLARRPARGERETLARLYQEVLSLGRTNPKKALQLRGPDPQALDDPAAAAWVAVARAVLNLDEFVTRD